MTPAAQGIILRRATSADAAAIAGVWLASWRATFDFPPAHPDEGVRRWIRDELVPGREMWVAVDRGADDAVVALLALSDTSVDQLYVAPEWVGRGVGQRLIELAKERRPEGLELFCFAVNAAARRFYERNGFVPVASGDGSRNMEHQPDVLYRWRPT